MAPRDVISESASSEEELKEEDSKESTVSIPFDKNLVSNLRSSSLYVIEEKEEEGVDSASNISFYKRKTVDIDDLPLEKFEKSSPLPQNPRFSVNIALKDNEKQFKGLQVKKLKTIKSEAKKRDGLNLICNCKKSPILIVDDNPFNLEALQMVLKNKF